MEGKKNIPGIIKSILFVLCFAFFVCDKTCCYYGFDILKTVFKGFASLCFVILGIFSYINCVDKSSRFIEFARIMLAALIVSFASDILIDFSLYGGFCGFFCAQIIFFFAFLCYGKKITFQSVLIFVILTVLVTAHEFLNPILDFGMYLIPLLIYMVSLFVAVAKSSESLKFHNRYGRICFAGTILFAVSDFLLQFHLFADLTEEVLFVTGIVSNSFYYAGQLLLAFSLGKDFIQPASAVAAD